MRRGDVAQDRLGLQAAQRGQRGLVEAAALVGRGLEGALQAAGDRGQPGPAQQPDRCFAAGGQPVQDVAQGGAAVRGRDEQLPDQPFGALGEVRVGPLVPGADGLGEVRDQVLRVGHIVDAGQRVPPPGLLGAADPLRVQHEHPPDLGAQPDGEGVDVDLVRGGHHRPDRGQHRGHHQGGGLVRPRPGDLQDARLPRWRTRRGGRADPAASPPRAGPAAGGGPAPRPGHPRRPAAVRAAAAARGAARPARPCRARRGGGPATAPRSRTGRGRCTTRSPRRRRRAPGRSAPRRRSRTAPGSRGRRSAGPGSPAGSPRPAPPPSRRPSRAPCGRRTATRPPRSPSSRPCRRRGCRAGPAGRRSRSGAAVPGSARSPHTRRRRRAGPWRGRAGVGECQAWSVS